MSFHLLLLRELVAIASFFFLLFSPFLFASLVDQTFVWVVKAAAIE